jgi:hypothetical protein
MRSTLRPTWSSTASALGDASAKTTLDTYGHLFACEEDRTRAAIDAEFGYDAG